MPRRWLSRLASFRERTRRFDTTACRRAYDVSKPGPHFFP